jgi:plasmid maintenance system antidote protein VapI
MRKAASAKAPVLGKTPAAELQKQIDKFGLSKNAVAKAVGLSPITLNQVLIGHKKVDIELSLLFGKYFGTGEAVWIELQRKSGLAEAKAKLAGQLSELKKATPVVKDNKKASARGPKAAVGGAKRGPKAGVKKADDKKPLRKVVRKPKDTSPSSSIFN